MEYIVLSLFDNCQWYYCAAFYPVNTTTEAYPSSQRNTSTMYLMAKITANGSWQAEKRWNLQKITKFSDIFGISMVCSMIIVNIKNISVILCE